MQKASLTTYAQPVVFRADDAVLHAELTTRLHARGLVLFAHGSGSSRLSPRNRHVAHILNTAGFSTFLFDLLTDQEVADDGWRGHLRFNINLLAHRLMIALDWLKGNPRTREFGIGCFGASTGAAAALVAAAERPEAIQAVVSRGGRPDLAWEALPRVQSPTLLIVGGNDPDVLGLNRNALKQITAEKELRIVPGATHLFEEPGALDHVAQHACHWFRHYLHRPIPEVPLETRMYGR